jgi:tRNA-specific 2-thiouridylase
MMEFLKVRIPQDPGIIITTEGVVVGEHDGVQFYTIGQRHGMRVGGGEPYYVVEKRQATKELVVASQFHPALYKQKLCARRLNWLVDVHAPRSCEARIRYRQPVQDCQIVALDKERVVVRFHEHQRAVTPGQSIVFYDGDTVLGGGEIE